MLSLGWGDPIESPIVLIYRRQGEQREHDFSGPVGVLGEDRKTISWLTRQELPLVNGRLDLTQVPVVGIGGKRKHQPGRVQSFLQETPAFQGALLLYPGSGNWDLGEGLLFLTSRAVLSGRRMSGGRPEVQLTNHRWLRDGRYVADRARMLHGKVLENIETAVEQEPGSEKITEVLTRSSCSFDHRLHEECKTVANELCELEGLRVILTGENPRDMTAFVREKLIAKLNGAGVRKVAQIPASLSLTAAEVEPELVAQAETLGTIEIPGLGRRRLAGREHFFIGGCAIVKIPLAELTLVTDWAFTAIGIRVPEVETSVSPSMESGKLHELLWAEGEGRWPNILGYFAKRWMEVQRQRNYPQAVPVADPRETDPSSTPDPVVWGKDLLTGETKTAFAALHHKVGGYHAGWFFSWYDAADDATKAEAEARREAGSYITARRLEVELTANAKAVELPVSVPAPYVAPTHTPQQILAMAGFTEDQYRIREDVGHWYSAGWPDGRDSDGEWSAGCPSTGSFAQKDRDGMWEIGQSGLSHLFEGGQVGNYNRPAFAKPVLAKMGAGKKIATIQADIKAEREASEEAYCASVRSFAQALQALPAYASLSSDMQAKLASLAESTWSRPIDEAELRKEWAAAVILHARQSSGEVLINWGGHFRTMGATGNHDYWVVTPDGSLRLPDEVMYRGRYTSEGHKQWRLVGPEELAITWSKAYTAADHEFTVAKLPTGSLTHAQLETVKRLESEIAERFQGATGMSGKSSPGFGKGWGLAPKPAPKPTPPAKPAATPPAETRKLTAEEVRAQLGRLGGKFSRR